MQFSVQPYVLRFASAIQVMNEEVEEHLEATSLPLHHLRRVTVQQGYIMAQEFHPGYNVITCLQDVNWLEHDHWVNPIRNLPYVRRHAPWWNLWQDARYPVTNADHIGQRAVVHAVDPADLGLPEQPDGHAILLYAYEGEEFCSVLEGNGFCFPGSDQCNSFLHCQGDEILSAEQQFLGVYFPFFPHEDALIAMETIDAPDHVSGIPKLEIPPKEPLCHGCLLGKAHEQPFPPLESRGDKSLALVHTDLCEFPVGSRTHNTWMMTFLDDFSGYGTIIFRKKKSDVGVVFPSWFVWAEKSSENKLLKLRLDHGGEYMSSALRNFLSKNGIEHQKTVPHTPQQNGRAEHFNRTLLDKSEAMRQQACLLPTFWQDAIETSLHIYNQQPMCHLNWHSPIQLWNGTKPDVSYFRTFGCQAYVFIPKDSRANKLAPKSEDVMFIGYEPGTKGYRF